MRRTPRKHGSVGLVRLVACAACIAIVWLAYLTTPARAQAATWSEVFAEETDTTAFLAANGGLLRAPFSLASAETLWTPTNSDFVARLLASQDGARMAWLTRLGDEGLTWLWTAGQGPARSLVGFLPLQPRRKGVQRYEGEKPSIEDRPIHGARLLEPSAISRRVSANAFAWTPDGSSIAFAYDLGLGVTRADMGAAHEVSVAEFLSLTPLDPAPFYLSEVLIPPSPSTILAAPEPEYDALSRQQQQPKIAGTTRWYLLYPAAPKWKLFEVPAFEGTRPWTADESTVWWADRKTVRSARAHDPTPTVFASASDVVLWLEHDPARASLAWVAGRSVVRVPAAGGAPVTVFSTATAAARVFTAGGVRALWAGDSLVIWRPADDRHASVALGGVLPSGIAEAADGTVFVAGGTKRHSAATVYRADLDHRTLVPTGSPELKDGVLVAAPSRTRFVWFRPAARPPATLQVFEVASGSWRAVENPGVIGWEPWRGPVAR